MEAREARIALAPHLDSEVPTSSLGDLEVTGHPAEALAVISSGGERRSMLADREQSRQLAEMNLSDDSPRHPDAACTLGCTRTQTTPNSHAGPESGACGVARSAVTQCTATSMFNDLSQTRCFTRVV